MAVALEIAFYIFFGDEEYYNDENIQNASKKKNTAVVSTTGVHMRMILPVYKKRRTAHESDSQRLLMTHNVFALNLANDIIKPVTGMFDIRWSRYLG